jgi:hypothetical protein
LLDVDPSDATNCQLILSGSGKTSPVSGRATILAPLLPISTANLRWLEEDVFNLGPTMSGKTATNCLHSLNPTRPRTQVLGFQLLAKSLSATTKKAAGVRRKKASSPAARGSLENCYLNGSEPGVAGAAGATGATGDAGRDNKGRTISISSPLGPTSRTCW